MRHFFDAIRLMPAYRLPVARVLTDAFRICFGNLGIFSRALALPILIMAATVIYWRGQIAEPVSALQLLIPLWWAIWFTLFAITCHRLALLGPHGVPTLGNLQWTRREIIFLSRLLLVSIGLPVVALTAIFLLLAGFFLDLRSAATTGAAPSWVGWAVFVGIIYFLARWSLVFPAAALDEPLDFARSWAQSNGNGWRLALIVGIIPAALEIARSLLLSAEPSAIELVLNLLVGYALLAVQIVALSLAYQEIQRATHRKQDERAG